MNKNVVIQIQIQYLTVVRTVVMLCKVVLTCESVDKSKWL